MDVVTSLHQDSIHGVINPIDAETPHQEPQRTCTRNLSCLQQGCMICSTLINHVRNLDMAMNNSNAPQTSLTTANSPQLPINHLILTLTTALQDAIQENDIIELTAIDHLYRQTLKDNLDFFLYDRSNLRAAHVTVKQLLASHITASTPLPDSPHNSLIHSQPTPPPSASFKPPKLVTDSWSGVDNPMTSIPGCPPSCTDSP